MFQECYKSESVEEFRQHHVGLYLEELGVLVVDLDILQLGMKRKEARKM